MLAFRPTTILLLAVCALGVFCQSARAIDLGRGRAEREAAIKKLPMNRLTPQARQRVNQIISHPTMFRRLPTQGMDCDRDMFLFLVRYPEVLVGIWDLMDITKVQMHRTGPYTMVANDGQGTTCEVELIYGDSQIHLYVARGKYDGAMVASPITGSGVFVLHSSYARSSQGRTTIGGQMDVFLQLDSLGADLVVRTLGPLIGKSADHNFIETAKFMTQISQASEVNPEGVETLGRKLPQVSDPVRERFIDTAMHIGNRDARPLAQATPALKSSRLKKVIDQASPKSDLTITIPTRVATASLPPAGRSANPVQPLKYGMRLRR